MHRQRSRELPLLAADRAMTCVPPIHAAHEMLGVPRR